LRLSENSPSGRPDFGIKFRRVDRESPGASGHDSCVARLNFSLLGFLWVLVPIKFVVDCGFCIDYSFQIYIPSLQVVHERVTPFGGQAGWLCLMHKGRMCPVCPV